MPRLRYLSLLIASSLLIILWSPGRLIAPAVAQPANYPQKKTNYQDFTKWYLNNYSLKELPYRAATLIDATTGTPLYFHQESTAMPTASLIKMVTAGTLLSYKPNWYTLVSFTDEDNEGLLRPYVGPSDKFSLLKLEPNESITLEQSFASMLIGSANNSAVSVGRAVGLNHSDFISAMKQTAGRWGMSHTNIEEPSGLSLNNTSTAEDLARAACTVYSEFMASFYGSSPSVNFTTSTGTKKTVQHTVHDVRNNPARYFGAKTGYLTETQYHIAAGIITPSGHRLCATILTSPTRAASEQALNALRLWADAMYSW